MTATYFFTDTATAGLTYAGEGTPLTDDNDVPSGAETATRSGHWADFFDTEDFLQFEATVAQPITQPYFYDGKLQHFRKTEAELKQAQPLLDNTPWTLGHPPQDSVTDASQIRGFWEDPRWSDGQQATLNVPANDPEAIQFAVENDEVSIGFRGDLDWVDDADDYDAVQRNMVYDHVASVESGRCPPDEGCKLHLDGDRQKPSHSGGPTGTNPPEETYTSHGHVYADSANGDNGGVRTTMTQEAEGEPADDPQFSQGDWVEWDWSGGTGYGKVIERSTSETLAVEGGSREGTPAEPAYKLLHWDDGKWGNMVVKSESELRAWSDPPNDPPSMPDTVTDGDVEGLIETLAGCSEGGCRCGLHTDCTASHAAVIDAEVNGEEIDLVPPEAAQNAAQAALDARDDEDIEVNGMTEHGWSRAEQLASGEELSPADIVGGTGAMAPWWSRHASHTLTGGEELSLKGADKDNPWADNSYTAGKGWGGVAGFKWAIRKGNAIHRARGKEEPYDMSVDHAPLALRVTLASYHAADATFVTPPEATVDETTIMDTVTYDGLSEGKLDESEIPTDEYEGHYVFDADTKSESSYPLIDADGNLRRGNVKAAWELYGRAEDEQFLLDVLSEANDAFAQSDDHTAPIPENSLTEAMTDETDDPVKFYDGEPDIETLADDFAAVASLQEAKSELEAEVEELTDSLHEHRKDEFTDKAERLAELVDSYEVEDLVQSFEDGEMSLDEIEEKVAVAEEAVSTTTTTTDGGSADGDGGGGSGNDRILTDADDVRETPRGKYDLSAKR